MTRQITKKDPKKEWINWRALIGTTVFMALVGNIIMLWAVGDRFNNIDAEISVTNRLLSMFQRIDKVKDDPNLCSHIKTDCHNENCKQTCDFEMDKDQ